MDSRDLAISRALPTVMEELQTLLAAIAGEQLGISLVVHPFSRDGSGEVAELQYISNLPREHMHAALKALVEKWDRGDPSIPPHTKQ